MFATKDFDGSIYDYVGVNDYARNQFCEHIIQIHTTGKIRQFIDSLPMAVLEYLDDHEWPMFLSGTGPEDHVTDWTCGFLNTTLYSEAVVAFKQAVPEAKAANAREMGELVQTLTGLNEEALQRLKQAIDSYRSYDESPYKSISLNALLHNLDSHEREAFLQVLGSTTVDQIRQALGSCDEEHVDKFRSILRDMTDEQIRKNTDSQTADVLISLRQDMYDNVSRIESELQRRNEFTREELNAVILALNVPTVDNLQAMKRVLGYPAVKKLRPKPKPKPYSGWVSP